MKTKTLNGEQQLEAIIEGWKALYKSLKEENERLRKRNEELADVIMDLKKENYDTEDRLSHCLMVMNDCWLQAQTQRKINYANPIGIMKMIENDLKAEIDTVMEECPLKYREEDEEN